MVRGEKIKLTCSSRERTSVRLQGCANNQVTAAAASFTLGMLGGLVALCPSGVSSVLQGSGFVSPRRAQAGTATSGPACTGIMEPESSRSWTPGPGPGHSRRGRSRRRIGRSRPVGAEPGGRVWAWRSGATGHRQPQGGNSLPVATCRPGVPRRVLSRSVRASPPRGAAARRGGWVSAPYRR